MAKPVTVLLEGGVEYEPVVLRRSAWVCHGSDCPIMPHTPQDHRCIKVTRVDDLERKVSVLVLVGDAQEGPVNKTIAVGFEKDTFWGGGFWSKALFLAPHALLKGV